MKKLEPARPASTPKAKRGRPGIFLRRIYDPPATTHGSAFLVDRIWPRGITKSRLSDLNVTWLPAVAPSTALRKWFGHKPARWMEFRRRYLGELEDNRAALKPLFEAFRKSDVTLLFSARDMEMNQAVVLKEFLGRE